MNEKQNNQTQLSNPEQPMPPQVETNATNQPLQAPKTKNQKKKFAIITLTILLIVGGLATAYYLQSKKDTTSDTTSLQQENTQEITTQSIDSVSLTTIPGYDGINFEVPSDWTVQETENLDDPNYYTYSLLSPDVNNMQDGYISISGGLSIGISDQDRNVETEKEFDAPWKSYVSGVGAPRIEDDTVDYYKQAIDYTEIKELTNPNGIVIHYYPWAYEGCYLDVVALSESKVFHFSITSGDNECLETTIIKENKDIATFINSLSFSESKNVTASAYVKDLSNNDKEGLSGAVNTTVLTKNIKFRYKKQILKSSNEASSDFYLFATAGVPVLNEDQTLKILNVGETAEAIRQVFDENCSGCGFSQELYDENIQYIKSPADTSEYEMIAPEIYGKMTNVTPASKVNNAKQYEYLKKVGDNSYFEVRFIAESSESDYSSKLPSLDSKDIITFLNSIVVVQ